MTNSIIYINMNTDETTFKSALQGYYYFSVNNGICVNMSKSVMIITSKIFDDDFNVNINLPSHDKFYLTIKSSDGNRNVLIDKDEPINMKISSGESIEATVYKSQG